MRGILKKELAILAMLLSFAVVFSQNTQDVYSDVVNYLDYLTVRTSSISSTVYYLDCNANSSYVADFMYDENLRLYSLDRLPDSHFVVGGKNLSDMRYYVVRDKQAGAVSQCHRYATTGVSIEPIITGIQKTAVATEDSAPQKITKCTPSDIVLYSDCSE